MVTLLKAARQVPKGIGVFPGSPAEVSIDAGGTRELLCADTRQTTYTFRSSLSQLLVFFLSRIAGSPLICS